MNPDPSTERRIAEAFRALAVGEVPSTAPRPDRAPRPVATGRGPRRRRLQLAGGALLAVAAAVVVALVLGTEVFEARTPTTPPATVQVTTTVPAPTPTTAVSTPTTPPPGTSSAPPPTLQQVEQAFAGVAHSNRSDVVTVPGGYEGADLDAGTIRFWHWTGAGWAVAASSTYPPDAAGGTTGPSYSATITAAGLLTGMDHATFVVTGQLFTGDSTGSTLAYTDGPAGWGVVKAAADGLLHPSGEGFPALGTTNDANLGLSYGEDLVDGFLRTTDCSPTAPDNAHCGLPEYEVVKYWRWDGTAFVRDH